MLKETAIEQEVRKYRNHPIHLIQGKFLKYGLLQALKILLFLPIGIFKVPHFHILDLFTRIVVRKVLI